MRAVSAAALVLGLAAVATALKEPPTSLQIGVLKRVDDCPRRSTNGDKLTMHYRGTLFSDGSQFDASYDRGEPLDFTLGQGMVIKGWDQGLLGMCVGEKRQLTIPSDLGYGAKGAPPAIPPNAALVFETELIAINGDATVHSAAASSGTSSTPSSASSSVPSSAPKSSSSASSSPSSSPNNATALQFTIMNAIIGVISFVLF